MGVAGDDELGFGAEGAGEDVIVIGIARDHRSRKCFGCDGLCQARVVLNKLDSRDPGGTQTLGKLVASHDFGEFGNKQHARAESDL